MNPKTLSDSVSWVVTLLTFVLAFAGILVQPVALKTFRPGILPTKEGSDSASSSRHARMWDDPFVVFPSHAYAQPLDLSAVNRQPTLVLAVLTHTSTYPEDSETRLRERFAVQAALRDAGYVPEDPSQISYFQDLLFIPPRSKAVAGQPSSCKIHIPMLPIPPVYNPFFLKIRVPTQRFFLKESETAFNFSGLDHFFCVQVVWIPEEVFSGDSPQKICSFLASEIEQPSAGISKPYLALLCPADSDMLARMISIERHPQLSPAKRWFNGKTYPAVISCQASASDYLVRLLALKNTSGDAYYKWTNQDIRQRIQGRANLTPLTLESMRPLLTYDGYRIERAISQDDD